MTEAVARTSPLILQEMQPSLKPSLATASVSESSSTQAPRHRDAVEQERMKNTQLWNSRIASLPFVPFRSRGFRGHDRGWPENPWVKGKVDTRAERLLFSSSRFLQANCLNSSYKYQLLSLFYFCVLTPTGHCMRVFFLFLLKRAYPFFFLAFFYFHSTFQLRDDCEFWWVVFAVIYVLGVFMSVKLRGNKEVAVSD